MWDEDWRWQRCLALAKCQAPAKPEDFRHHLCLGFDTPLQTRLWLGGVLSTSRDMDLIVKLIQKVRHCALCRPVLFCVGGVAGRREISVSQADCGKSSTISQINFVKTWYNVLEHELTKARRAHFQFVDALLLGRPNSAYASSGKGCQDWGWLECRFIQ